ncbi:DgyrCDS2666 [Dimorphilus gyrociliatus]|uniref:DgyrCDS2666 n=1 Tax=Dimorphilus gyrociliatus TaxID=2664684 RepID=A0A7I8VAZ3_9ANNE|nr:DgyrCDS2666 [Dimorphilus gyrociliatus]
MDSTPRSKRSTTSQSMYRSSTVEHHGAETVSQVKYQRNSIKTRKISSQFRDDQDHTPSFKHSINTEIRKSTSSTKSSEKFNGSKNSLVSNWFEVEPKTDYTYSHTTSYQASGLKRSPPPNLSRRGLKQGSSRSLNLSTTLDRTSPNHTRAGTVYNNKTNNSQYDISLDENFKDFGSEKDFDSTASNNSSYIDTASIAELRSRVSQVTIVYAVSSFFTIWSTCVSYFSVIARISKRIASSEFLKSHWARYWSTKSVKSTQKEHMRSSTNERTFHNVTTWRSVLNIVKTIVTPSFIVHERQKQRSGAGLTLTLCYFLGFFLFSVLALALFMCLPQLLRSVSDTGFAGFEAPQIDKEIHLKDKNVQTLSDQGKKDELANLEKINLYLTTIQRDLNSLRSLEIRLETIEESLKAKSSVEKDESLMIEEIAKLKKNLKINNDKMSEMHDKYDKDIIILKEKIYSKSGESAYEKEFPYLKQAVENLRRDFTSHSNEISGSFNEVNSKMETYVTNQELKIALTNIQNDILNFNKSLDTLNMFGERFQDISEKIHVLESAVNDCKNSKRETDKSLIELRKAINSLKIDALQKNCCDEEKILSLIRRELKSGGHELYRDSSENLKLNDATKLNSKNCMTRGEVNVLVKRAFEIHLADKTGLPDYALESAGGSIVDTRCSVTYTEKKSLYRLFGMPIWYVITSPRAIIQPEMQPGNCWAMKGSKGSVVISLATKISPTSFSLEHISRKLSMDGTIASAPKDFSVIALEKPNDKFGENLGNFTYSDNGETLQNFAAKVFVNNTKYVLLKILSNHGQPSYTCIYRFRVHGHQNKP